MAWRRLGAILLLATGAHAQFSAAPGSPFAVGSMPRSVAAADFNADGKLDLVTANFGANTVTVLLGNGSGGFSAAHGSPFAVGSMPSSVAVGDLNGDGNPDLVIANFGANTITVLLGNGSGGFTAASGSPFAVGANPQSAAIGDFNGDGNLDIVTANSGDNTVTVLLGNGSGGFMAAAGSPFAVGTNPQAVVIGDINRDGKPDIVTANSGDNSVTVLLGNGSGQFTPDPGNPFAAGANPQSVALGDLNGDGNPDIVTANAGDNTVNALLGDGTGNFAPGAHIAVGSKPWSVALKDFNGDGVLDFATANSGDNTVTVLLGNGSGGFTAAAGSPFAVGATPPGLALGDFNGDGQLDFAAPDLGGNTVTVLLNMLPPLAARPALLSFFAAAGQAAPVAIPVSVKSSTAGSSYTVSSNQPWLGATPASNATGGVTTVYLSANAASLSPGVYTGTVRYRAPNYFDASTQVTLNVATPSGTLQPAQGSPLAAAGSPQAVATGDFNRDGKLDLVTANYSASSVTVLLGDGSGGFTAAPGSPFAVGANPASVAVADFNGDGIPDLAIANSGANNVTVLLGNGAGGFTPAAGSPFPVGAEPQCLAVADFNGDGRQDLVTANYADQDLTILLGNGSGGFTPAPGSPLPAGSFPRSVAVGDFNGDGKPDLVTAIAGNFVTVFMGNGAGGFSEFGVFPVGAFAQSVAVVDFNLDGRLDIVTANSGDNTVSVLLGNGAGAFTATAGSPFTVGKSPQSVAVFDINGDGRPDIVTANSGDNTVTVLLGNGSGGFTAAPGNPFAAGAAPINLTSADFNGDGRPDIATANGGASSLSIFLGRQAATSSVLTTTAGSTVTYGTLVPLTLTVTLPSGSFDPQPTGSGTFLDGATVIGTGVATGGSYVFGAGGLSVGNHTIAAQYGADPANAPSTSNTLQLTITPGNQTITFGPIASQMFGTALFAIGATASSGLAISFVSTTASVCTVSGVMVTLVSTGVCTIQASQAGGGNYSAAPVVSQNFLVTPGNQTITFGAIPNQTFTPPFPVNATASSGLTVSLASTTPAVCTVQGSTVTLVSLGLCTIRATQAGNSNYSAAPSVNQSFSVTQGTQTIVFAALADQAFGTAPFALTATASSGLVVGFTSATAAVCTVAGATVTLVKTGTCTIKAAQAGNSNYAAAPAVSQSFQVTQGTQTITFAPLASQTFGAAPFMVSATASSGLAVSFTSTTSSVCTVSGATVAVLTVGVCTIQANQTGNSFFGPAAPVTQFFSVTPGSQTITFAALANKALGVAPFTVVATASSGLPVGLASNSGVCTVAGFTVTLALAGTCTIQATQPGNADFAPASPVVQSFTVTPKSQTITFAALTNQVFGAAPFTVAATASSGLTVSFASIASSVCSVAGTMVTLIAAGVCSIQANQPGDGNYAAATPVVQHFTVTQGSQTISFGPLSNAVLGAVASLSVNATASSGLAVSFTSTTSSVCTVTGGTVTLVGLGTCGIQAAQAGNANYKAATPVVQLFTVSPGVLAIESILNAGSYSAGPLASDEYAVAFGANFSTTTAQSRSAALPATLAGATVTVTDSIGASRAAALFYVSPTQIDFVVPEGLASGSATVTVNNSAGSHVSLAAAIAKVSPSLFTADSSGTGVPAALSLSYTNGASPQILPVFSCSGSPAVCTATPINLGSASTNVFLALFGTGIRGRSGLSGVSVTLGGVALQVTYAGAQGTDAGLDQINALIDRSLIGMGALTLQLVVDGVAANPVTVDIQ